MQKMSGKKGVRTDLSSYHTVVAMHLVFSLETCDYYYHYYYLLS
jgi:hypothetical protein